MKESEIRGWLNAKPGELVGWLGSHEGCHDGFQGSLGRISSRLRRKEFTYHVDLVLLREESSSDTEVNSLQFM